MGYNNTLTSKIKAKAKELGFDAVGISKVDLSFSTRRNLKEFIDKGRHGKMKWMSDNLDRRLNPTHMWSEAKTAVVVLANYSSNKNPLNYLNKKKTGLISVYAQNEDYHPWIKGRLKNLASFTVSLTHGKAKVFVDTAPLMEKPLAEFAGLGWIGKHTNLINRDFGNWTFIGVMLLDIELMYKNQSSKNLCGSCQKCIDICPTKAFLKPYKLDARKCISYLTIELKDHIPRKFRPLLGNRIYGCDDCLAVCPWNKFAKFSNHYAFKAREEFNNPSLIELSGISDSEFRVMFSRSPIKRIGRDRLIRNVLIAMGNSSSYEMLSYVVKLIDDDSVLVKVAAIWALGKLSKKHFLTEREKKFSKEKNKEVKKEWVATYNEIIGA